MTPDSGNRMGRLEFFGLELLPMLPVDHPATAGLDMLPRRHRGRTAGDRYQVLSSLDLHSEDGETILRVVERDPFNQASQALGHRQVPASLAERMYAAYVPRKWASLPNHRSSTRETEIRALPRRRRCNDR